jgi:ubiquinone/menaquinone biosynthesis C-methylase UbiE
MTMALLKRRPRGARPTLAVDFSRAMLSRGARKFGGPGVGARKVGEPYAVPIEADALHLPLRSGSLDLIVSAFGFRNLANYEAGLREFHRVLKPGGQLGILEFSEPGGLLGKAYAVYFRRLLPAIGRLVCGKAGAYSYLPVSVGNFPAPKENNCHNMPLHPVSSTLRSLFRLLCCMLEAVRFSLLTRCDIPHDFCFRPWRRRSFPRRMRRRSHFWAAPMWASRAC